MRFLRDLGEAAELLVAEGSPTLCDVARTWTRSRRVVALAMVVLGAASGCGDEPGAAAGPSPTPLFSWLTEERKELLSSSLEELGKTNGWVAACVFESSEDKGVFSAMKKPSGRVFYTEFTDETLNPALVIRVEGAPGAASYTETRPNASTYCLSPQ